MHNLYIDFDGVILDTIPALYKQLEECNIEKTDFYAVQNCLSKIDWKKLLEETKEINDSISCIKKLRESNKFNIFILTHINSLDEGIEKIKFLETRIPDITKIIVPKAISKTKMVETKGAILVDDHGVNLDEWKKEGGIPIKFSLKDKKYEYTSIARLDKLLDLF